MNYARRMRRSRVAEDQISEQMLNTRPDVALGGGAKSFSENAKAGKYQGKTLREQAQAGLSVGEQHWRG